MKHPIRLIISTAVLLLSIGAAFAWSRAWRIATTTQTAVTASPSVVASPKSPTPSPSVLTTPSPVITPSSVASPKATSIRLTVPFTVQAPDADWSEPWAEGCEEAALLMAQAYKKGNREAVLPVTATKSEIAAMVEWQKPIFGGHLDLGVDGMARIAKEYMGETAVTVKHGATLEELRNELRAGHPVIVTAAGQKLQNPYFTPPGPPYHVFVLVGFEGDETFIAHENGTKRGQYYRYSASILEDALYDLDRGTGKSYLVLR